MHPGNDGATVEVALSSGKRKCPTRPLQTSSSKTGSKHFQRWRSSAAITGEVRRGDFDQFLQEQEDSF